MRFGMRARAGVIGSALLLGAGALLVTAPAFGGETVTYHYDAQGRLVKVARAGTVNNGTTACYAYDDADNRTNVAVSTATDCAGPGVSFSVNNVSVTEGGNLVFTVQKTGSAAATINIDYATANGTASAGSDYTAKSGTLSFLTTDTSKTVSVATTDDGTFESAETLFLNLSNPTGGATVSDGQGQGTINDNDDCSAVSYTIASNGAVTEGANSVFTVTKAGSTSASCAVNYATAGGTAASGSDFTAASGTLTFTSSQTSRTVSVATADDTGRENSETFTMSLSSPNNGASLGSPSTATATINDNDQCNLVSFSISSNHAVTEGDASVFTVTKSGPASVSCTVHYATANGTAAAGSDYTAKSGTLTFTSTQASQAVGVATTDDAAIESAETFMMSLSSPSLGGALGTSSAVATINDNDTVAPCSTVSFSVNDPPVVTEGDPLTFTVSKTGTTSSSCSVSYATANGTAIAGTNYVAKSGTLTFSAAQSSQNVVVTTIDTQRAKGVRTMFLNLSNATNGSSIVDNQGTGSIDHSGDLCITCLQSVQPDPAPANNDPASSDPGAATDPTPPEE